MIGASVDLQNSWLNYLRTQAGNAAILELHGGTRPATGAGTPTPIITLTCGSPFAPASTANLLTLNSLTSGTATAGNITWGRFKTSGGTFLLDCSVTQTGGGGDLTLPRTQLATGESLANSTVTFRERTAVVVPVGSGYVTDGNKIRDGDGAEVILRGVNVPCGFQQGCARPDLNTYTVNGSTITRRPEWMSPPPRFNRPVLAYNTFWRTQIETCKSLGFNAFRIPISGDTIHESQVFLPQDNTGEWGYFSAGNPAAFAGKTPMQVVDMYADWCEANGVYFLIDFHQATGAGRWSNWTFVDTLNGNGIPTYNGQPYLTEHWVADLANVAARYAGHSMFIGIELINEPANSGHGSTYWGTGNAEHDAIRAGGNQSYVYLKEGYDLCGQAILAANPKILLFLQGTQATYDFSPSDTTYRDAGWGGSFARLIEDGTVALDLPSNKTIWTPHAYGPGTLAHQGHYGMPLWTGSTGAAINPTWQTDDAGKRDYHYGSEAATQCIVPTEWGGDGIHYSGSASPGGTSQAAIGAHDADWLDWLTGTYYPDREIKSSFLWAYGSSSGDVSDVDENSGYIMQFAEQMWDQ